MSVNTSTTFTYSPLVAFIAIAETKNSGRRKQKPTKIAIHHAAGKMTGKQLATFFKYGGRYASANYCVGYDGDVALSVWEEWIPWTTSSTWCDSQAITIEISNSATGGNWPVSDKSLEIAIQLCVYICKKYGIKNCSYTGDKNGVLQMHKWYTPTGCPGTYLGSKFPYISKEVNRRLGLVVEPVTSGSSTVSTGVNKVEPYFTKVTVTDLNIRKTPDGEKTKKKLGLNDVVKITKESDGWGYAEGKGWISLKYTSKVQGVASAPTPALVTDALTAWIAEHHLKIGSEGELVGGLQAFLYARGYKISIDRKFGKETDDALKKYQISQGLDDDGIVGQKTWRVMFGQK